MDVPLLILAASVLLLAGVVGFVGVSYQPECTPLTPRQPQPFRTIVRSLAAAGVLLLGLGALGVAGFVLSGVILVALATTRA